jgi:hypothetical protein
MHATLPTARGANNTAAEVFVQYMRPAAVDTAPHGSVSLKHGNMRPVLHIHAVEIYICG